jgi:hypothetical protein
MEIPFKQMLDWRKGNFAPTVIGLASSVIPLLAGKNITLYQGTIMFGLAFIAVGLIKTKGSPTIIGALCTALLGLTYFFRAFTNLPDATLWIVAILLFAITLIFEFDVFKFGPSSSQARMFIVIPLATVGFAILLGIAGLTTYTFNWKTGLYLSLSYIATMLFCWISVFDLGGYKPFKTKTVFWCNVLGIVAALFLAVSIYQQGLLPW